MLKDKMIHHVMNIFIPNGTFFIVQVQSSLHDAMSVCRLLACMFLEFTACLTFQF